MWIVVLEAGGGLAVVAVRSAQRFGNHFVDDAEPQEVAAGHLERGRGVGCVLTPFPDIQGRSTSLRGRANTKVSKGSSVTLSRTTQVTAVNGSVVVDSTSSSAILSSRASVHHGAEGAPLECRAWFNLVGLQVVKPALRSTSVIFVRAASSQCRAKPPVV